MNTSIMNSNIKISNLLQNNNELTFNIQNINVSLINALRRTIISDIDTISIRTTPYEKNDANFIVNTSRFHNEMLKQRLSSIPIHIKEHSINFDDYIVECNVSNDTDSIKYITTQDFKIKYLDKYLDHSKVKSIFPKDPITGDYILFAKLKPKINDDIPGEKLHFQAKMSLNNANTDGTFNVVSTCSYSFTPDPIKQNQAWAIQKLELQNNNLSKEDIDYEKENWFLNNSKRYYKDNTFDFIIKTLGVFTNEELIIKGCDIIINNIQNILNLSKEQTLDIVNSTNNFNSFDIILNNQDYTIGKCIEFALHQFYYLDNQILSFVGFTKKHPHDTFSIIRLAFIDESTDKSAIFGYINNSCDYLINSFNKIKTYF
jgi:DNA-directed RNA polymerase subunit L